MNWIPKRYRKDPAPTPKPRRPARRRGYDAAKVDRLRQSWTTYVGSPAAEILAALVTLRARSRDLAMNDVYVKKFLKMVRANVVGNTGIMLQSKAKFKSGDLDETANGVIEKAWKKWGKKGVCTVCGQYSWIDIQNLAAESVARDGEVLIRKHTAWPENDFKFALELIEADHLSERLNEKRTNGNLIRGGVEFNQYKRPVAYWLSTAHPGDAQFGHEFMDRNLTRVSADKIIHLFLHERIAQPRGVPWTVTPAARINMLNGYEEAELVAARAAAAKMGFIQNEGEGEYSGDELVDDDDDDYIMDAEAGVITRLNEGETFKEWDPTHPTTAFDAFTKNILRGIATGLNVSYVTLANDLEGVSFSSIRQGVLDEREAWKALQTWLIEHFIENVWREWLVMAMTSEQLAPLMATKLDKYNSPEWRPRRWAWIDPLKDIQASIQGVKAGITSPQIIAAEQGRDVNDVLKDIAAFNELAESMEVKPTAYEGKSPAASPPGNNANNGGK